MKVEHFPEGSSVCLDNGKRVECRLLVDCSGHHSELVEKVGEHNPGVQIAYGAEVEVKGKSSFCLVSMDRISLAHVCLLRFHL